MGEECLLPGDRDGVGPMAPSAELVWMAGSGLGEPVPRSVPDRLQAQDGTLSKTAPKTEPLRVTHLQLENWRNFTSVDVELQARTFVVGPNAAGKSNLLDVLRFVRDVASVGGGFQAAVRLRGGVSALRCLAARQHPAIAIRIALGTDDEPERWSYSLKFSQDSQRRPLVREEVVKSSGKTVLTRPEKQDERDPDRLTQTHLEQVNANRQFREINEFLSGVRYLHLVPQLVREPDRSVGRENDPYGGDFLEQVAQTQKRTQEARLRRITNALQVAVPQLSALELERDGKGQPHIRGKYEHWRPQGAWQREDQFSDGTLRLMGLLWAVMDGNGPLLLEEPELSLHPEVVAHLPQMFAQMQKKTRRQILVSTHSSDLLRDSGIGLDEVLLLVPSREGTSVAPASSFFEVRKLLESGVPLDDILRSHTRPERAEQLAMFNDG